MLTAHDKIFDANKQADTYSQCRVNYFSIKMPLLFESKSLNMGALAVLPIEEAGFVHVTNYLVKPEDKRHSFDDNSFSENSFDENSVDERSTHQEYLAEQATAWQADHNASEGFLGGYIAVPVATAISATNSDTRSATHSVIASAAQKVEQPQRYLIITFWATALAYQQHQAAMICDNPNSGRCLAINPSISQVFSIQFDINRAWDVIPDNRAAFTAT
jgi:hypothetical protein